MNRTSCVVVLSGGQDSTTCLFKAAEQYNQIHAVSFDYGQRHKAELECAKKAANRVGAFHKIISVGILNELTVNALTRTEITPAAGKAGGLPTTFVDGRNMLFLTLAAIYAKQNGINDIITGVCQTDFSGYPDCRDVFVKSLNTALDLAMDYSFNLITPLMWLTKAETWNMADELGVLDYIRDNTLTCYNGVIGDGCGTCPACVLRKKGLEEYFGGK